MNKHQMKYSTIYDGDEATAVTVYWRGRSFEATPSHPNFRLVVMALEQGRPAIEILELFDTGSAVARGFERARELVRQVATEAITRVQARREGDRPKTKADLVNEVMKRPGAEEAIRNLAERTIEGGVGSTDMFGPVDIEAMAAKPPTVVQTSAPHTEENDDLEAMGQRQLQTLANQLTNKNVVGKSNAWLRDQIREARANNLVDVSAKVDVIDGRLYFDGEEMNGALADAIIAYHRAGHLDFTPLVWFMAKLLENPNPHSREHLYQWMTHLSFTIADDGDLIAYKGVRRDDTHGYVSDYSHGTATVNGVLYENQPIPNPIGGVVEMPREKVTFDPKIGCSTGLHIGTVNFATSYGTALLELKINPRDIISVPTENEWQKLRVCKYLVSREVTAQKARQLRSQGAALAAV